jgi:hypothetical protein
MVKSHQVFVGCPFLRAIRKNYDKLKRDIEKETPLHVVLADTAAISSTDYLLEHITNLIRESAGCIFDVTGGNPNVSLEVGVAHAMPAEFLLTLYTRKPRSQRNTEQALEREGEVRPIISDLQGRNRIEYKTYTVLKEQVLSRYIDRIPYMRRWAEFRRRNRTLVKPALTIFSEIRTSGRTIRPRVIAMLDGTGIDTDTLMKALSQGKLLTVKRGRNGGIYYPQG